MNERSVREWIIKAEKAYLIFNGKEIKRTHIIEEVIKECAEIDPEFQNLFEIKTHTLTDFAVGLRYPGNNLFPSLEETEEAIEIAEKVKVFVLRKLKEKDFKL